MSPIGFYAACVGFLLWFGALGYIALGNDYGRPWLLNLIGVLGWLSLAGGVLLWWLWR